MKLLIRNGKVIRTKSGNLAAVEEQHPPVQEQIKKIIDGATVVGNAAKLNGVEASSYAKLTDIPQSELLFINGLLWNDCHLERLDRGFDDIISAIELGKIPVLRLEDERYGYPFIYWYVTHDDSQILFQCNEDSKRHCLYLFRNSADYICDNIILSNYYTKTETEQLIYNAIGLALNTEV